MMRKLMQLSLALALAAPALPALAGRPVDQTLSAERNGKVEIELGAGRLTIRGWDRPEVRIQGTVPEGEDMFEVSRTGDVISIEVALPDTDCDGDDCDWDMDVDSDDVHHAESDDSVRIKKTTKVKTRSRVHVVQEDTKLELDVPFGTALDVEAISSQISVSDVSGEIDIESISGDVDIDGEFEELSLEVVSGRVTVNNRGRIREADIEAVSGGVELRTDLARDADVSIETVNGGIEVWLPADASCKVTAETFSGDIENEFGQQAERDSNMLPSKSLEFVLDQGLGEVALQTFNGTISIHKK